jgi:TRAP-type C4-dicarboxylate transport system permease small subunit
MRKTSRVLGIVGAAISILFGLLLILGGSMFLNDSLWENAYSAPGLDREAIMEGNSTAGMVFIGFGIAAITAGILGLVGGIIVKRKNVASGVMMIVAAVISLFTFFNIASMTLFIIGAVMALKREPQVVMAAYLPYPPPPYYYPYPQQYPQYPPQYPPYPQPPAQTPPEPPHQQ